LQVSARRITGITGHQPCGKHPQCDPQGPEGFSTRSPAELLRDGVETMESSLLNFGLPQVGQTGRDDDVTNSSDSRPQSSQAYS
jgi:hypothetical protein